MVIWKYSTPYPRAVSCIIATEFFERLSFCGIRSILSLYLRNYLHFSENTSTVIYHVFNMSCYILPLFGAICADSYYGSYNTIRNFAVVYILGNIFLFFAAVPVVTSTPFAITAIGLTLIAVGTGGIKPCLAAFGGEQFKLPAQKDMLRDFFSIFYFAINLGGFIGMIITPLLRKHFSCFGDDTCYALGFGVPAALLLLAFCLFLIGRRCYDIQTPKSNIIVQSINCACYAIGKRCTVKGHRDHWLDYSKEKYSPLLINDMKTLCSILYIYMPLPIFWSLFDQQGSRWTFQASHMDGNVLGTTIVPDQMQVINPAIVLIFIPLFDRVFYPCFAKYHILRNSLHRMAIGGIMAALAFLCAGILELFLERTYPHVPEENHAAINVINTLSCNIKVINPLNHYQTIRSHGIYKFNDFECHNTSAFPLTVLAPLKCGNIVFQSYKHKVKVVSVEQQTDTILIAINENNEIRSYITDPVDFQKSLSGDPRIRIAYVKSSNELHNVTVTLENAVGFQDIYFVPDYPRSNLASSAYMELPQGTYECKVESMENRNLYKRKVHLALGGVYSIILTEKNKKITFVKMFTMSKPNSVNILWLIPQYVLISVAEIMFGVAGLEFSFTQAPKSMKSVTIAGWYLSVAAGNLLVIIVTQLNLFRSQAHEFFLFAVLMMTVMMIFIQMASQFNCLPTDPESTMSLFHGELIPLTDSEYEYYYN